MIIGFAVGLCVVTKFGQNIWTGGIAPPSRKSLR